MEGREAVRDSNANANALAIHGSIRSACLVRTCDIVPPFDMEMAASPLFPLSIHGRLGGP